MKQHRSKPHSHGQFWSLYWEGNEDFRGEGQQLGAVFHTLFGYECIQIPIRHRQPAVKLIQDITKHVKSMNDRLERSGETGCIVLHYSGYGDYDRETFEFVLAENNNQDTGETLQWCDLRGTLRISKADILLLFDACSSVKALNTKFCHSKNYGTGSIEMIAASDWYCCLPGPDSFSSNFERALTALYGGEHPNAVTLEMIYNNMVKRKYTPIRHVFRGSTIKLGRLRPQSWFPFFYSLLPVDISTKHALL